MKAFNIQIQSENIGYYVYPNKEDIVADITMGKIENVHFEGDVLCDINFVCGWVAHAIEENDNDRLKKLNLNIHIRNRALAILERKRLTR